MHMISLYARRFLILCAAIALCSQYGVAIALAQTQVSSVITSDDVALLVEPQNPEPNTQVTITLNSYTVNLSNHPIQWYVNDRLMISQVGADTYTLTTGALGTQTNVKAIINVTSTGNLITKSITLSPGGVDLLWEATDSYVPPFYKGKKLPSPEGEITVSAIPITNRSLIAEQKAFVYYWNNDFQNSETASGYGKRSFTITNDVFNKTERVGVTASSTNGAFSASKSVTIPTFEPKLVFYTRTNAGRVRWEQGTVNALASDPSGTTNIIAEPYFFSVDKPWQLQYTWRTPTQLLSATSFKSTVTMPTRGATRISVTAEHPGNILQTASAQLQLNY